MNATVKDLTNAYKLISNISNLNKGGCLYAAYGVWLHLTKQGFTNVNIVQLDYDHDSYHLTNNKSFINKEIRLADSGLHFGVTVTNGRSVYDSNGLCNFDAKLIIPFDFTTNFSINSLKYGIWNPAFDVFYIREINKRLGVKLRFYKGRYGAIPKCETSYYDRELKVLESIKKREKNTLNK